MKAALQILVCAAVLIAPAAASETADPACLGVASLADEPLPEEPQLSELILPETELLEPQFLAVTQQVGCPEFRPCSGASCTGTPTCGATDTGNRCCYDQALVKHCCPQGRTVHAYSCACAGTACNNATSQTAVCF